MAPPRNDNQRKSHKAAVSRAGGGRVPHNVTGIGVGLRSVHFPYLLTRPALEMDWFEAISENVMDSFGRPRMVLEFIREDYPVALHGVSLSIGSEDVDRAYLARLKALAEHIDPFLISDHICWTRADGAQLHDLLPLPFTNEAVRRVVENVSIVQEALGRPIALENVSSYLTYKQSEMSEWEFLRTVADRSGCGILLDVNNVYVNARNHGYRAVDFLDALPDEKIWQIHLAGFTDKETHFFDTHSAPVHAEVWTLFQRVVKRVPRVPVLLEWDEHIPEFPELQAEALRARKIKEASGWKRTRETRRAAGHL